jgi:hypothetical protein
VEVPHLDPGTKAAKGLATGAAAGAALGGLLGAALATAVVPGVGPILAAGLLAAALGSAGAGAASGSVLGALVGLGIPEHEAQHHEQQFHSGRTLVAVHAGERYDEAVEILRQAQEATAAERHDRTRTKFSDLASDQGGTPGTGTAFVPEPE